MKNIVLDYQRNKSIEIVFGNFPDVTVENTEIQAALETYAATNIRCGELLALLARPRTVVFLPKHHQLSKLRVAVTRMAGIGVLVATRQQDGPKTELYKVYKLRAWSDRAWELSQTAIQVAEHLTADQVAAVKVGLKADKLAEFKGMAQEFGTIIETTDTLKKQLKAARQELITLMKVNMGILRLQLDPFANFMQEAYPAFFREYKIARRSTIPQRPKAATVETLTEITGTVTDSITGEPVANATIDIADRGLLVVTDQDGYYELDEMPDGGYLLSCHATGYKLAATENVTIADGISLEVNFSLEPETVVKAA